MSLSFPLPATAQDHQYLGQLQGAGLGYAISQIMDQHSGLTVIVTLNSDTASRIETEVSFFSNLESSDTSVADHEILSFPDWEILPFDTFSPHQDIISQRLYTLGRLPQVKKGLLILPISTLLHRLPPKDYVQAHSLVLKTGQQFDVENMRRRLESTGYRAVSTVMEHGEFAVRGSIMDIFPMGSQQPIRIDMFDDEIDTLRTFDPDSQRSVDQLTQIELLPAREFPLDEQAINHFRQRFRERFDVPHNNCPVYQDVSSGLAPAGIEYYLPLFFEQMANLVDYLPENTLVLNEAGLEQAIDHFMHEVDSRWENRRHDVTQPILDPVEVFLRKDELFGLLNQQPRLTLSADALPEKGGRHNLAAEKVSDFPIDSRGQHPLLALETFLMSTEQRVLFCAESAGRRESLLELLNREGIKPAPFDDWESFRLSSDTLGMVVAPLEQGVTLSELGITLIAESQLFGEQRVMQRRRRQASEQDPDLVVRNLTELRMDAPVVHLDHGVGRYRGLVTLDVDNQKEEFVMLEYADQAKLYVPVANLHLISRYSGSDADLAPLHKLGTDRWSTAKRKAAEKIRDTAAELLNLYARRQAREGFTYDIDELEYQKFSASFPFEETPDQVVAIEAVKQDMKSTQPMDRLVCGDVGFGKTEVAMRAAFIAVQAGKQVAILVPTTLLAQQHYENFLDRFADWPVRVEVLSRFRTGKQTSAVLEGIDNGSVDIVVGTHKLLQKDVKFKNLGLLIIDEEHRFGVQQKETIKALRANVDILTLTATPIPRTLNMSMASIRDLSIIATPPARRLSVKTFVRQSDDALIKEAILREILRGGQVYYLHNEVDSIEKTAEALHQLVPEARITVGHGQMNERQLERVMSDFYHKKFNVLVCTTIIETGIDVPTANTIIIDRADKFGLAQLHQLRGRVGRSHHQAYAYLLTPPPKQMTADAHKRLDAISEAHDLGAGFTLATHDLEIRGAGELLGEEQSGQMEAIGYSLYMDMLNRAVKAIQSGKEPDLENPISHGAEVNLHVPALIPDDYVPDINGRLTLYKRIASCQEQDELRELQVELIDRFGLLPDPVKNLFRLTSLRLKVEALGIAKIDAGPKGGTVEFESETQVEPFTIVQLIQTQPTKFKLNRGDQLKFTIETSTAEERFGTIESILKLLVKETD